jgi:hypothetical protein
VDGRVERGQTNIQFLKLLRDAFVTFGFVIDLMQGYRNNFI